MIYSKGGKEKNLQEYSTQQRVSFRIGDEEFAKQNLKDFITTKTVLQEMFKGILWKEKARFRNKKIRKGKNFTGKCKHKKSHRLVTYKNPIWRLKHKSSRINYIYKNQSR